MSPLPDTDLGQMLDELVPVVRAAATFIAAQSAGRAWAEAGDLQVSSKADATDFVTRVDTEVETRMVDWLTANFPGIGVLAEEGTRLDAGSGRFWVLDPLDGTRNFIKGYPGYCVSLALVQDGSPVIGLVHDVEADALYTAVRGEGSYLAGRRLQVAREDDPALCMAGVGYPVASRSDETNLQRYLRLLAGTAALRQGGAVARELALLARGSLDAFWQPHLSPWDIAAGMLLVEEAGGKVETSCTGDWLSAGTLGLFAASQSAFAPIRELIE